MKKEKLCYFDNGATSFPKPCGVEAAMCRCIREYCGNPGRGSHSLAMAAAEKLYEARSLAAKLFNAKSPECAVLAMNATHSLNIAIRGLVPDGCHVIISDLEHNSLLRPVEYLKRNHSVSYSIFSTKGDAAENAREKIRKNTRAIICTHVSNITNFVMPLSKLGTLAKDKGLLFIVDASQSAGSHTVDMEKWGIDALCLPGHKGLLGPQGTGFCIFGEGIIPKPLIYGGSGSDSRLPLMPEYLPDRLEGGTMATPAFAGLCEGMKYVLKVGTDNIRKRETAVMNYIKGYYANDERIETYSEGEGSIWLFNIKGTSSQKTASALNELGVCVRAGLHCAPLAHSTLNTPKDGAVRVSAGALNTLSDAKHFCRALDKVLEEK